MSLFAAFNTLEHQQKQLRNAYYKITPNLLFEYQCTSGKFIRLPNRIESTLFRPNWNALVATTRLVNASVVCTDVKVSRLLMLLGFSVTCWCYLRILLMCYCNFTFPLYN